MPNMNANSSTPSCDASGTPGDHHPLELIPWFRRFHYSWWRDLVYTFIWNMGFALFFWSFQMIIKQPPSDQLLAWLWAYFVVSNCIGYSIHLCLHVANRTLGQRRHGWHFILRVLYYTAIPVAGVLLGYVLGFSLLKLDFDRALQHAQRDVVPILLTSLIVSLILCSVFFLRERQAASEAELAGERSRNADMERRALVAHLRMLQAQIEPHFLFNTLANVVSLIDSDSSKAKTMLENLIQYLRSSLATVREERTTLAREAELLRAYLNVLTVRMGPRLRYRIDIPADLGATTIAPMLLQPLVENAVKHGLEPKIEGGEVRIAARREGDMVVVNIADSGLGVSATVHTGDRLPGSGVGLANLRERLRSLYGDRASLQLADRSPAGTEVTVRIPLAA